MDEQLPADLSMRVRVMQIIVLALGTGIAIFFVIATYLRMEQAAPAKPLQDSLISLLAAFFTVSNIAAFMVVPGMLVDMARRKLTPSSDVKTRLLGLYQVKLIVGSALLEGAAFFLLLAYMLEGQLFTQILAAVMLAGVVAQFPTHDRVENWLREQEKLLAAQ